MSELTREQVEARFLILRANTINQVYDCACALEAHDAALRAKVEELEKEREAFKDQCRCMYCGRHYLNVSICSKCTFTKPAAEPFKLKALEAQLATLTAERDRLREVLRLCDPQGERMIIQAPEDPQVRELCERVGYGAVMDSAARQWRKKDPIGAFTVGPCAATVQAAWRGEGG